MSRTRSSRSGTNGGGPNRCRPPPLPPTPRWAARSRCTTAGQIDLLPLLDAQRTRLTVRISANDSNTQLLLDSVQLYKALGGGWQAFEPADAPAAANATRSPNS